MCISRLGAYLSVEASDPLLRIDQGCSVGFRECATSQHDQPYPLVAVKCRLGLQPHGQSNVILVLYAVLRVRHCAIRASEPSRVERAAGPFPN